MTASAKRFFSSSSDSEGETFVAEQARRNQYQNRGRKPVRTQTQLVPQEVFDSVIQLVKENGVAKMLNEDLTQTLMQLTRSMYIDPKRANANDSYKEAIRQFTIQIIEYYKDLPYEQVPIGVLADYTNCLKRFRLGDVRIFDVYEDKLKQVVNESPGTLDDMPFYQFQTIVTSLPQLNFNLQTRLLEMMTERYNNLDTSLKPERTVQFMHDFTNSNIRIPKTPLKTMILAANKYLLRDEVFSELDTTTHARLLDANAMLSADQRYQTGVIIRKEIELLSNRIDELQEKSVLFCINACSKLNQLQYIRKQPEIQKFLKDLHSMVIQMATANADLVDFYFITKYLSLLAESDPKGKLIGNQKVKSILEMYNQKLQQPNVKQIFYNYRNDAELSMILKEFEPSLPNFAELLVERLLARNTKTGYFLTDDLKRLKQVLPYLSNHKNADQIFENVYKKIEKLLDQGYDVRFNVFQMLHALPKTQRRDEIMEKCDVFNLSFEHPPKNKKVLSWLAQCSEEPKAELVQRQLIDKILDESLLVGDRRWNMDDLAAMENLIIRAHTSNQEPVNPIKTKLLPYYKTVIQSQERKQPLVVYLSNYRDYTQTLEEFIVENLQKVDSEVIAGNFLELLLTYDNSQMRNENISFLVSFFMKNIPNESTAQANYLKSVSELLSGMPSLQAIKFSQIQQLQNEARLAVKSQMDLISLMHRNKQQGIMLPAQLNNFASECIENLLEEIEDDESFLIRNLGMLSKLVRILGFNKSTLSADQADKITQKILAQKDKVLEWEQALFVSIPDLPRLIDYLARSSFKKDEEIVEEEGQEGEENGGKDYKELKALEVQIKDQMIERTIKRIELFKDNKKKVLQEFKSLIDLFKYRSDNVSKLNALVNDIVTKVPVEDLIDIVYNERLDRNVHQRPQTKHLLSTLLQQIAKEPALIEKVVKTQRWLFIHTALCSQQNENDSFFDTNLHNIFIQDLGRRFENLNIFQCIQLARNMSVAGTNQSDIMEAIVDKVITGAPDLKNQNKARTLFFNLLTSMINLNMQDTNSFKQVLNQFTASKETEAVDSVNTVPETNEDVKKEFLLGVIARDLTSNPDIKPIFDDLLSKELAGGKSDFDTTLIALAVNAGLCGDEFSALNTNQLNAKRNNFIQTRLTSLFETNGNDIEEGKTFGNIQCNFYLPKYNTAILTARKEASYLIDDKTMKVRAALMKKILEKEAPDTKFHFVNGRTFNQLNKGNLVLKQLIQKDWQIPAEISPEIAAKIAERKAGEAQRHEQVKAERAKLAGKQNNEEEKAH